MPELNVEEIQNCFDQLASLETEFDKVDIEILRETALKQQPLFEKRNAITNLIPNFWPNVFEEASATIGLDEHITPEDAETLATLVEFNVTRPDAKNGDPRNLEISFKFKENDYLPAQTIIKKFTYQPSEQQGLTGLVSTPVVVSWKPGKDLTSGINKLAIEAFEERKSNAVSKNKKGKASAVLGEKDERLVKLLNKPSQSFFNWFSFTGAHSELGEIIDEDDNEDTSGLARPIECFPFGDELAIQLAEDLYPSAVKYFAGCFEASDGDESDIDLDEVEMRKYFEEDSTKNNSNPIAKRVSIDSSADNEPVKKKPRNRQ